MQYTLALDKYYINKLYYLTNMQPKKNFKELLEAIPEETRKKWEDEQNYLKTKLILTDDFTWKPTTIKYV